MKREKRLVDARRKDLLAAIQEKGEISVEELAQRFSISTMTIRRDLLFLEERRLVERFYGGVRLLEKNTPLTEEEEVAVYRDLIARAAANLVKDNDTIFINGSSTALGLLHHVGNKQVRVITNNASCVNMQRPDSLRVILTGGMIHGNSNILVGDNATRNLLVIHANKTFLGFAGISANGEVACDIPQEIGINELMAGHCDELFILVDHTKIGKTSSFASCSLEAKWTLITDEKADPEIIQRMKARGTIVYQVSLRDRIVV